MEEKIKDILKNIVHPAEKSDIVSLGMVEGIKTSDDEAIVILRTKRVKDPFAEKIKRAVEEAIVHAIPAYKGKVSVIVKGAEVPERPKIAKKSLHGKIGKIIAVSSSKGGVGKSTVTALLAKTLAARGFSVGILDTDIYGPSMPESFGLQDYRPDVTQEGGKDLLTPARVGNLRIMSIGFFIESEDALIWRGPMATSALKQLIHQTAWGDLDYLLIDLPPGTGDVHLTLLSELKVDGAIIVTTPQKIALVDVVRGISMFRSKGIEVPVLGLVENMAWFSPADAPEKRYYIFGKGGGTALATKYGLPLLAEIPLVAAEGEAPLPSLDNPLLMEQYNRLADNVL